MKQRPANDRADIKAVQLSWTSRRSVLSGLVISAGVGVLLRMSALAHADPDPGLTQTTKRRAPLPRPRFADRVEQVAITLPAGKQLGSVVGVSRAPNGDIFLLQDVMWANPALPEGAQLPPVVHLNRDFKFVDAWGGPDHMPSVSGISQWPSGLDNLECDEEGNVWIGGYGPDDDAALKFSPRGKLLLRIGQRGRKGNNDDTEWLNGPVSFYVDVKNREVFIADGYRNNRVIAFNSETGKFTRMWGAYGKKPSSAQASGSAYGSDLSQRPIPPSFGNPVHKVARAPDGRLYVCDRINNRVQEFELVPGGVRFLREIFIAPGTLPHGSAWDIAFTAEGKYMYVADSMNLRIWIADRNAFAVLGWTSAAPEVEGDDNISTHLSGIHRIAIESSGDLLMARTIHGLQRLRFLGVR
jgi:hypothetical protein